jgi:16S rRNA (uracil1498-N3)-methyltransferase
MKTHRFFLDSKIGDKDKVKISDKNIVHQIKDVLRFTGGEEVILLDGFVEFSGRIESVSKKEVIVFKEKVKTVIDKKVEKMNLHLFASITKKDKFEWVLQKATEIGVSRITPIISERTEKNKLNMDRADKIVREAAEQSGRTDLPFLDEPTKLSIALKVAEQTPFILDINAQKIDVPKIRGQKDVCIFVGPEGGWGQRDRELFDKRKVEYISLGKNVLRAETASVSIASILLLG